MPDRSTRRSALLPSEMWLQLCDEVLYEWLARAYYWWRGWLP
jgi:hypothetical protein